MIIYDLEAKFTLPRFIFHIFLNPGVLICYKSLQRLLISSAVDNNNNYFYQFHNDSLSAFRSRHVEMQLVTSIAIKLFCD